MRQIRTITIGLWPFYRPEPWLGLEDPGPKLGYLYSLKAPGSDGLLSELRSGSMSYFIQNWSFDNFDRLALGSRSKSGNSGSSELEARKALAEPGLIPPII